jgi:hypothetical protein
MGQYMLYVANALSVNGTCVLAVGWVRESQEAYHHQNWQTKYLQQNPHNTSI